MTNKIIFYCKTKSLLLLEKTFLTIIPSLHFHGLILFIFLTILSSTNSEFCPPLMWYKNSTCFAPQPLQMKWQMSDEQRSADAALLTSSHLILHLFSLPSICPCMDFPLSPIPSCFTFVICATSSLYPFLFHWPFASYLSSPLSLVLCSPSSPSCLFSTPKWSILQSGQIPWQLNLSVGATAWIINLTKNTLWKRNTQMLFLALISYPQRHREQ